MSNPIKAYLERLIKDFSRLDSRGVMQVARMIELDLNEVFVNLKLQIGGRDRLDFLPGPDFGRDVAGVSPAEQEQLQRLNLQFSRERGESNLVLEDVLKRTHRWVILGDPGAGKTTLLRHYAVQAAQRHLDVEKEKPCLPIFITLRYFGEWLANQPDCPQDALLQYWAEAGLAEWGVSDAMARQQFMHEMEPLLQQGHIQFILDGLDEQRDAEVKHKSAAAIRSLDLVRHGNTWLVSSRIVGYGGVLSGLFEEATVQPFEPPERDAYLRHWMLAVECSEDPTILLARREEKTAEPDAFTRAQAQRKADSLIQQIEQTAGVAQLATNPLLCTIIGLMFLQGGTLPDNRADLYKLCIDTFIFNWEMAKRRRPQDGPQLDRHETVGVLERLALEFQENRPDNRASRAAIVLITETYLREESGERQDSARFKAENLFRLISEFAGLLIDRGNEEFGFFHLSFQEYLAARYITRTRRRMRDYIQKYCFDRVQGPRWREVMRLAAIHQGQKDPESAGEFIQCVLEQHPGHDEIMHYNFRFAFTLTREAKVEKSLSDNLWARWIELLEHNSAEFLPWQRLFQGPGHLPPCPGQVFNQLMSWARVGGVEIRCLALDALAETGDARAVSILIDTMRKGEAFVSPHATAALRKSQDPRALEALVAAISHEDAHIRCQAIESLSGSEFKEPHTLDLLFSCLRDINLNVRRAAVRVLARVHSGDALDVIIAAALDKGSTDRWDWISALALFQEPRALEVLNTLATDEEVFVREAAAGTLGKFKNSTASKVLITSLGDNHPLVRSAAAGALNGFQTPHVMNVLITTLFNDENGEVRGTAASSLGKFHEKPAQDALVAALNDEYWTVRVNAAAALSRLQDPRARNVLIDLLCHKDPYIRGQAAITLGNFQDRPALKALVSALDDDDSNVRGWAAAALGRYQDHVAMDALIAAMRDMSTHVRIQAALSLSSFNHPGAIEALVLALNRYDFFVCKQAAESIERIELGENL